MTLTIVDVSNDASGGVRIDRDEVRLRAGEADWFGGVTAMSDAEKCKRFFFLELPPGHAAEGTFAARKQLCVLLQGRVEVAVGGGNAVELGPGDVVRLADTDFQSANRSVRVVGTEPAHVIVIQLE